MAAYLRKVKQGRWLDYPEWLDDNDSPADCLPDLRTVDNALSVYRVDGPGDARSIERVTTALAANCERLENIDYVIVDASVVAEIGLTVHSSEGQTPDAEVNLRHVDIVNISSIRLGQLAGKMRYGSFQRVQRAIVQQRIADALTSGHCLAERLHASLVEELRQRKLV